MLVGEEALLPPRHVGHREQLWGARLTRELPRADGKGGGWCCLSEPPQEAGQCDGCCSLHVCAPKFTRGNQPPKEMVLGGQAFGRCSGQEGRAGLNGTGALTDEATERPPPPGTQWKMAAVNQEAGSIGHPVRERLDLKVSASRTLRNAFLLFKATGVFVTAAELTETLGQCPLWRPFMWP